MYFTERGLTFVGPPKIGTDLLSIKPLLSPGCILIMDLNIRGWIDEGVRLLDKMERQLKEMGATVVIWSKYLFATTVFDGNSERVFIEGCWQPTDHLAGYDAAKIQEIRKVYPSTRAFVSKLERNPIEVLHDALDFICPN
jgi:hypothetical protein